MDLLDQARDHKLVQFGENVREQVAFICNCCGCCCEAMLAAKRFAVLNPIATTNFLPEVAEGLHRLRQVRDGLPGGGHGPGLGGRPAPAQAQEGPARRGPLPGLRRLRARLRQGAPRARAARPAVLTPVTTAHRAVLMAIERGKLQKLIFDNQAHWNHRAMAAILGVILKLPPVKQAMASRQMKVTLPEQAPVRRGKRVNAS